MLQKLLKTNLTKPAHMTGYNGHVLEPRDKDRKGQELDLVMNFFTACLCRCPTWQVLVFMAMTALTGTIRTITATPANTDGPRFCTRRDGKLKKTHKQSIFSNFATKTELQPSFSLEAQRHPARLFFSTRLQNGFQLVCLHFVF